MRKIERFECELCGHEYELECLALACEAKGIVRLGVKPGDIVSSGSAYGWCTDPSGEWWLEERGDPKSRSHLERAQLGWPLFVVLEVRLAKDTPRSTYRGDHQERALLYSPHHLNQIPGRFSLHWASNARKRGEVPAERLAELAAEAEECRKWREEGPDETACPPLIRRGEG